MTKKQDGPTSVPKPAAAIAQTSESPLPQAPAKADFSIGNLYANLIRNMRTAHLQQMLHRLERSMTAPDPDVRNRALLILLVRKVKEELDRRLRLQSSALNIAFRSESQAQGISPLVSPSRVAEVRVHPAGVRELGAVPKAEPAQFVAVKKRKGRPPDKLLTLRRKVIREVAALGFTGQAYCLAVHKQGLCTPIPWQKNEGCPKTYPDAYSHPNLTERKKWRDRIADEKYKATTKVLAKTRV